LSEDDREPWIAKASDDRERYEAELEAYNNDQVSIL
jgi:hypothetical protein